MSWWYWLLTFVAGSFALGAILGAPFVPVRRIDAEAALDLAELKAGQTLVDLGCGDGRLLIGAAQRGAKAIGYEINPLMYAWAWLATRRYRGQIKVYLRDFWQIKLPPAEVIYIFILDRYVERLDRKFRTELDRPTKVVSYVYALPRKPVKETRNTYLYRYP